MKIKISTADKETTPLIALLKKCFRSHRGPRLVLAVARTNLSQPKAVVVADLNSLRSLSAYSFQSQQTQRQRRSLTKWSP